MGFLEVGNPLEWQDSDDYHSVLNYVSEHGIKQFLEVWNLVKDRKGDELRWGDELEFHIFSKEDDGKVKLALCAHDIIAKLQAEDEEVVKAGGAQRAIWHPEYGAWMIEATPNAPFGGHSGDFLDLEPSLRYRRKRITQSLPKNHGLSSIVAWPLMGVGDFCRPGNLPPGGPISESLFLPDALINPHPRFGTLTRNIRKRRGKKVDIRLPLYQDIHTKVNKDSRACKNYIVPSFDHLSEETASEVYMDAMGFGMGCCCLQVTFQARDVIESRVLYDQLAMLCPVFLALTAASPIFKGLLVGTDARWDVIAGSVDDRTPMNLGAECESDNRKLSQRGMQRIAKSRYDTISCFISDSPKLKPEYNDIDLEINEEALKKLISGGIDKLLARHVAHLFIRDPLVVFGERISQVDDRKSTEHFENIQSTNWNTMRWKPPGLDVKTGWRVEFRPMEKQLTDFEDAAFITFVVLLSRVILFFDLNLYIPISKVDENMKRAHQRDAISSQKFFFRKKLLVMQESCGTDDDKAAEASVLEDEYEEMTIEEILLGKGEDFPGILSLVEAYLDIMDIDEQTMGVVSDYMKFIVARATGELPTPARYIRDWIQGHPLYNSDSVISEELGAELVLHCEKISNGQIQVPGLLGYNTIIPLDSCTESDRTASLGLLKDASRRLRGSSFHEEIAKDNRFRYRCPMVKELVEAYKNRKTLPQYRHDISVNGFDRTKAYLKIRQTQ